MKDILFFIICTCLYAILTCILIGITTYNNTAYIFAFVSAILTLYTLYLTIKTVKQL